MANQSPEEIHVKHIRAPDYREIPADGTLHKIVDNHLVITFYIEDSRVTAEVLKRDGDDSPNLRIAAIQEERQRLDVMAVRIPTKAILGLSRRRCRAPVAIFREGAEAGEEVTSSASWPVFERGQIWTGRSSQVDPCGMISDRLATLVTELRLMLLSPRNPPRTAEF